MHTVEVFDLSAHRRLLIVHLLLSLFCLQPVKMAYSMLADINPTSKHWKICVRVSRLWEYRGNVDGGNIQHLDLVLIDEQGGAIYAEVPADYVEAKRAQLQEGQIYILSRFLVSANKERFRSIDRDYMIELTYYTKIEEPVNITTNFPVYTYKLTPFADLSRYVGENRSFLDVVGAVISVSNIASMQSANQSVPAQKRVIILRDATNNEVKLTLWGQRAAEFDADSVLKTGQTKPVTILFVGVLMKRYGYEEGLTGNAACRWYVSPDITEATIIESSMRVQFQPISHLVLRDRIPPVNLIAGQTEEKTLHEIIEINPYDFPRDGLRCTVTISKLAPAQSWWFFSCNKYSRKSNPDGTSYRCSSCLCRAAKPRYKLCVIGTDGTASAEFMLFGDIGQQVVGKQVGTVLRSNHGGDDIPPDIAQIVSKKFTWHVSITEKSFQGPRKSYQVNRIIVSLGRQSAIPRISTLLDPVSSSSHTAASNVQLSYSTEQLQHTPPHPQLIHHTEIEIQQSTKDVGASPPFTRKRLFDTASGSTEHDTPSKKITSSKDKDSPLDTLRNRPQGPLPDDLPPYVDTAEKDLVNKGKK